MNEIVTRRSLNSKHIDNGDGTFTMESHCGHIHYQDGQKFEQINTTLESIAEGWMQTKASYHLVLPKYSDGRIIFNDRFNANRELIFAPICNHTEGKLLDESNSWIQKRVQYANAFGSGIHLECTAGAISFRKEIVIDADPGTDVEVRFKLEMPAGKLLIDGEVDTISHQKDLTGKGIVVGDIADELTYLRPAKVWDVEGNSIDVPLRFEMSGQDIFLVKTTPATFLKGAKYPVRTDTTTSYYAGAGDGWVISPGSASWSTARDALSGSAINGQDESEAPRVENTTGGLYYIRRLFLPVDTSGLPNNATITDAIWKLYAIAREYDDNDAQAYICVCPTSQASTDTLGNDDYNNVQFVDYGSKDIDTFSTSAYNDLVMTVLATISKTGYSKLGLLEGHDKENLAIAVDGGTLVRNRIDIRLSEYSGTDNDPYLSVTYTVPKFVPSIINIAAMMMHGGR